MEVLTKLTARLRWQVSGLVAALVLGANGAVLAQIAPDKLVKSVADDVLAGLRQDPELKAGSQAKFAELLEQKVAPHFDFERMARLAVGRGWRQATPEQQQALVEQFRSLLIRSYSSAYTAYKDIAIDVKPVRMQPTDNDVQVRTAIKVPSSGQAISVDYSMYKAGSDWKIYDVTVEGVSLVTTYRSTFADEIRQNGVDGLIKSLQAKNSLPGPGTKKQP
jgi:phospholipid transport system substrate-binding protein